MTYEFRINGSKKLLLRPVNDLEDALFNEIFSGEVKVEVNASTKEVTLTKIIKDEKLA